ncbi:coiled-coil domain-containing protein 157-like [Tachysurus fulvidraco]|uniref:coiled-coil domain-containing protein 157-like n=1 Tax=Tachysurus fulvidraco TaxID=1234273 RepID=UPI001FEFE5BB|nr:coiled-coil domain-containing protein 157-like [Tachysurus fulvidraco]
MTVNCVRKTREMKINITAKNRSFVFAPIFNNITGRLTVNCVTNNKDRHRLPVTREVRISGSEALEVKISELEGELKLQRESQQCVEHERDSLVGEVYRLHQEEVRWKETEQKKRNLESELSDTRKLLDTERAKYHSSQRQHGAMMVKQRALLERTETLVQQCEELQVHLDKCEDEKAELTETLTHTTQEKNTLQEQLTEQKKSSFI